MTQKRKRPQAVKSRSILTRDMILNNRPQTIASGKAYSRKVKYIKGYDND